LRCDQRRRNSWNRGVVVQVPLEHPLTGTGAAPVVWVEPVVVGLLPAGAYCGKYRISPVVG
jgi:hypothetical protein